MRATRAAPASQTPSPSGPARQTANAPKKVWTNDDLGELRDRSAISIFGETNGKPVNASQTSDSGAKGKDANWYRDQMLRLKAKVSPLDDQIHQLEAALQGETVKSVRTYGGVRADDWRDQLARLEKQRADILAKIAALEDEARHNGVPVNALP